MNKRLRGLRKLNFLMAGLHLVQAIAILILSANIKLPVTGSYPTYDQLSQSLMPTAKTLFEMPVTWLVVGFFMVSAIAHFLAATKYQKRYYREIDTGLNRLRWLDYGLGAGLMMIVIAMLVGVYDIANLAMIFGLTAVMCLMGLVTELYNYKREKVGWLTYCLGVLAGLIPWLTIAFYLRLEAGQGSGAPTYIYFVFISIFIIFSSFAFNMLLHYRRFGKWADYIYTERLYIWLSLIAKTALAWQIFAGALRP